MRVCVSNKGKTREAPVVSSTLSNLNFNLSMNSAKQDEFEDLLAFNLSETRRISLSSQAKISTVEGFVSSYNWGRIHRIYGWIS